MNIPVNIMEKARPRGAGLSIDAIMLLSIFFLPLRQRSKCQEDSR